jgi:hypothetical protein
MSAEQIEQILPQLVSKKKTERLVYHIHQDGIIMQLLGEVSFFLHTTAFFRYKNLF